MFINEINIKIKLIKQISIDILYMYLSGQNIIDIIGKVIPLNINQKEQIIYPSVIGILKPKQQDVLQLQTFGQ